MVRKIVVEIDVESDLDSSTAFLDRFKNCLEEILAGLKISKYALREERKGESVQFGDDYLIPANRDNECSFQIGTMSFHINSSESSHTEFIKKCLAYISEHLEDETFNLKVLAGLLNLSKPTFYRKIKMITGCSARDFIRKMKMQIAYQLLSTKNYNVREVAGRCGYANARHFSKIFFESFGYYPSKLIDKSLT